MSIRVLKSLLALTATLLALLQSGCDKSGFSGLSSSMSVQGSNLFEFSSLGSILPMGYTGQVYTVAFATSNGTDPITFSLLSGSLPAGLVLSPIGVLSGKITQGPGSYSFSIEAQDSLKNLCTMNFSIEIALPFELTTRGIPDALVGSVYSAVLTASGGQAPYTYTIPNLPIGLSLDRSIGLIFGTPTATGSTTLSVTAQDSRGWIDSANVLLNVITPAAYLPTIQTTTLGNGAVGVAYAGIIQVSGGVLPYRFTVTSSALPAGLSLDPALGLILGTPTSAGVYPFTVTLRDTLGSVAVQVYSLTVTAPPSPSVTLTSFATGTLGSPYAQVVTATGGAVPYTFSISAGGLPAGLSMDSASGIITGTPSVAGSASLTLQVTDSYGNFGTKALTLTIISPPGPVITTSSLSSGVAGSAYIQTIGTTLGVLPYTYSVISGALPNGLILDANSGFISGIPSVAGNFIFSIQVTDHVGLITSRSYTLTISNPSRPVITNASIANGTTGTNYIQVLTASGGTSPYTFSIQSGTLPAGLSLDTASGTISGTPTVAGTSTLVFQASDSASNTTTKSLSITIIAAALPQISSTSLSNGLVGTAYAQVLVGVSGVPAYSFGITSGTLPTGLSLNSVTGVISGTPTSATTSNLTFQITDSVSGSSTKSLTLQVVAPPHPQITTTSLPNAVVQSSYAQVISVTPGVPPYTFSISSGSLPAGLSLSTQSGILSGIPTSTGVSSFTVSVTDSIGVLASFNYSLTVTNPPSPQITNSSLVSGSTGSSYMQVLQTTGGYGALTFSIFSGTLQTGLSLDANSGTISGIPTASGSSSIAFKVLDSLGSFTTKNLTLQVVVPPAPSITTASLQNGIVSINYAQVVQVTGGISPYTFQLSSGSLPAGLSFNSTNGTISGVPTAAGSSSFTVQVTDSINGTVTKSFSLAVNLPTPPVINNTSLAAGQVTVPYAQSVLVSGGVSPYTFTVTSGTLPAGLALNSATGSLSGTPTTAGSSTLTIQVQDQVSNTASQSYTLTVAGSPYAPLTFTNTSFIPLVLESAASRTISVTGGLAPYTFSITTGALPAGMTLSASSGIFSGIPTAVGSFSFSIQVTDNRGSTAVQAYTLSVVPPLIFSPLTLPVAISGIGYSATLSGSGGTSPYTYSATGLPSGIGLSTSGVFSGAASSIQTASVAILISDSGGLTAQYTLPLTVVNPLSITTSSLPLAAMNTAYSATLASSGGLVPVTYSVSAGSLPSGLTLNSSTGVISGSPIPSSTNKPGIVSFTVKVNDSSGQVATRALSITLTIAPSVRDDISNPLRTSAVGVPYLDSVEVTGGVGSLSYSASGLPTGLSIGSANGFITGTPSGTAGMYSVLARVTDANGFLSTKTKKLKLVNSSKTAKFDSGIVTPIINRTQTGILVVADLNGDGKPDVVTRNANSNEIVVGLSNGNGTFTNTYYTLTSAGSPNTVYVQDIDGDGKPDIIVFNNGTIEIIFGDGVWTAGGTSGTRQVFTGFNNGQQIAFADINGDGKLDFAVANYGNSTVNVYLNCGSASSVSYKGSTTACTTGQTVFNYYATQTYSVSQPYGVAFVDLNGDSKLDLAVTTWSNKGFSVFNGLGDGSFATSASWNYSGFVSGGQAGAIRSTLDLNGDGKPDLLIEGSDGAYVLYGNGSAAISGFSQLLSGDIGSNAVAAAGDINGDGCPDIVTVMTNASRFSTQIFYNNCAGQFVNRRVINNGYQMTGVGLGKFTGGTRPDLITVSSYFAGKFLVYPNNMTANAFYSASVFGSSYPTTGPFFYGMPPNWDAAVSGPPLVGDLNNDGYLDFIFKLQGAATVYLGGAGGTFTPSPYIAETGEAGQNWSFSRQMVLSDLNADGKLDLVSGNWNGGGTSSVGISLGNGDGSFGSASTFFADANGCTSYLGVRSIAVGDLNKDGKQDLVVGHGCNSAARISIFFGNGDGTFNLNPTILNATQNYVQTVVVKDVDGDGNPDIVVGTNNGYIQIYRGKGDGTFYSPNAYSTGLGNVEIGTVDVVDLNNDGYFDYLVSSVGASTWGYLLGGPNGTVTGSGVNFAGPALYSSQGFQMVRPVDWDDDGFMDVLAWKYQYGYLFYKGNGSTFTMPTVAYQLQNTNSNSYANPVIADFNGDGLPDFLSASIDGSAPTSVGLSLNVSQ